MASSTSSCDLGGGDPAYDTYLAAVDEANQVYEDAVMSAVADRDAAFAAAASAAQSAADGAFTTYQDSSSAAYQTYLSAEASARATYDAAVQAADEAFADALLEAADDYFAAGGVEGPADGDLTPEQEQALDDYLVSLNAATDAWVSAEEAAWSTYVAAEASAWATYVSAEDSAWTTYLSSMANIQANLTSAEQAAEANLDSAVDAALANWQSSEATAWNDYQAAAPENPCPRITDPPAVGIPPGNGFVLQVQDRPQLAQREQPRRTTRGIIKLNPGAGSRKEGTEIELQVSAMDPNTALEVDFNGDEVTIVGNATTDANGKATFKIKLKKDYPKLFGIDRFGNPIGYTIRVKSGAGASARFAYEVYQAIKD
ncbi:MAG TPA: hypothetical protein VNK04_07080 [Gemmataceae bacterium]|nr:hypothetical protein [Gemmataceae bacterium]